MPFDSNQILFLSTLSPPTFPDQRLTTIFHNFLHAMQPSTSPYVLEEQVQSDVSIQLILLNEALSQLNPHVWFEPITSWDFETSFDLLTLSILSKQPLIIVEQLLLLLRPLLPKLLHGKTIGAVQFTIEWATRKAFLFLSILMHYPALTPLAASIMFESDTELCQYPLQLQRELPEEFKSRSSSQEDVLESYLGYWLGSYTQLDQFLLYILAPTSKKIHTTTIPYNLYSPLIKLFSIEIPRLIEPSKPDMSPRYHTAHQIQQMRIAYVEKMRLAKEKYEEKKSTCVGYQPFLHYIQDEFLHIPQHIPLQTGLKHDYFDQWLEIKPFYDIHSLPYTKTTTKPSPLLDYIPTPHTAKINAGYDESPGSHHRLQPPLTQLGAIYYSLPIHSTFIYSLHANGLMPAAHPVNILRCHPRNLTPYQYNVLQYYPFLFKKNIWFRYQPTPLLTQSKPQLYPLLQHFCHYIESTYQYLSLATNSETSRTIILFSYLSKAFLHSSHSKSPLSLTQNYICDAVGEATTQQDEQAPHIPYFISYLLNKIGSIPLHQCRGEPIIAYTIYAIITLLPISDGFIVPYFIDLLPYQVNEQGYELLSLQDWEPPSIDTIVTRCLQLLSDLISYPSHFKQNQTNNHEALINKVTLGIDADNALYNANDNIQAHARHGNDGNDDYEGPENNFSLLTYLLQNANVDDSDLFLTLLLNTQQFELTQPIELLNLPLYERHNYIHKIKIKKDKKSGHRLDGNEHDDNEQQYHKSRRSYLLSTLIQRRYPSQTLSYFLNLEGLDWNYYDDFGLTILDYCIICNTYSYAPTFVNAVISRTFCHPLGIDQEHIHEHYERRWNILHELIIFKSRDRPILQELNITSYYQLYSYVMLVLLMLPVDADIPFTLIQTIIKKELYDQQLTSTKEPISELCDTFEQYLIENNNDIDLHQFHIIPFHLLLFLCSCSNIITKQSNYEWLMKQLIPYITQTPLPLSPTVSIDINHEDQRQITHLKHEQQWSLYIGHINERMPTTLTTYLQQQYELESLQTTTIIPTFTIFDFIWFIYYFIDMNAQPIIIQELLTKIPLSYSYYLFWFYKLPTQLNDKLILHNAIDTGVIVEPKGNENHIVEPIKVSKTIRDTSKTKNTNINKQSVLTSLPATSLPIDPNEPNIMMQKSTTLQLPSGITSSEFRTYLTQEDYIYFKLQDPSDNHRTQNDTYGYIFSTPLYKSNLFDTSSTHPSNYIQELLINDGIGHQSNEQKISHTSLVRDVIQFYIEKREQEQAYIAAQARIAAKEAEKAAAAALKALNPTPEEDDDTTTPQSASSSSSSTSSFSKSKKGSSKSKKGTTTTTTVTITTNIAPSPPPPPPKPDIPGELTTYIYRKQHSYQKTSKLQFDFYHAQHNPALTCSGATCVRVNPPSPTSYYSSSNLHHILIQPDFEYIPLNFQKKENTLWNQEKIFQLMELIDMKQNEYMVQLRREENGTIDEDVTIEKDCIVEDDKTDIDGITKIDGEQSTIESSNEIELHKSTRKTKIEIKEELYKIKMDLIGDYVTNYHKELVLHRQLFEPRNHYSPSIIDLFLTKTNYIEYMELFITQTPLLQLIPFTTRLSPSINQIDQTYFFQFVSQITCDLYGVTQAFHSVYTTHPPKSMNFFQPRFKINTIQQLMNSASSTTTNTTNDNDIKPIRSPIAFVRDLLKQNVHITKKNNQHDDGFVDYRQHAFSEVSRQLLEKLSSYLITKTGSTRHGLNYTVKKNTFMSQKLQQAVKQRIASTNEHPIEPRLEDLYDLPPYIPTIIEAQPIPKKVTIVKPKSIKSLSRTQQTVRLADPLALDDGDDDDDEQYDDEYDDGYDEQYDYDEDYDFYEGEGDYFYNGEGEYYDYDHQYNNDEGE